MFFLSPTLHKMITPFDGSCVGFIMLIYQAIILLRLLEEYANTNELLSKEDDNN